MTLGPVLPTGCRWADISLEDSEDEFSDSQQLNSMLPTAFEDSYQGKVDSGLEDSNTGLNAAMAALTSLSDSPIDFAFLLKAEKPKQDIKEARTKCQAPPSKKKRNMPGARNNRRVRSRAQKKSFDGSDGSYLSLFEAVLKDDGSDIASVSTLAPFEMPEATDEVWQHRQEARQKDIELIMATDVYKRFCSAVPKTEQFSFACPDPYDRTISKRKWKNAINSWHHQVFLAAHSADQAEESDRTPNSEHREPKPN